MARKKEFKMDTQASVEYDLLMNYANEFLIVFQKQSGEAHTPKFIFDRTAMNATLYKDGQRKSVVFSHIPEEALEPLSKAPQILCVETNGNSIDCEYYATVELK